MSNEEIITEVNPTCLLVRDIVIDGVCAKHMKFPANFIVEKHIHDYDHISILASGKVGVYLDNIEEETIYTAPTAIVIEAGVEHTIYAIEDSVWFCIHNGSNSDEVEITENVQY